MNTLVRWFQVLLPLLSKLPIAAIERLFTSVPQLIAVALPFPKKGEVLTWLQKVGIVQPLSDVVEPAWEAALEMVGDQPLSAEDDARFAECCPDDRRCKAMVEDALLEAANLQGVQLDPALIITIINLVVPLLQAWWRKRHPDVPTPPPVVDPAR